MWDWIEKLQELSREEEPFVMVTVIDAAGSTPRDTGSKMLVCREGRFYGSVGGGILEQTALADAEECLKQNTSAKKSYPLCSQTNQCCGGRVELFFEVMNMGPNLYIFGAGHVGQALCRVMDKTPFSIHLIDEREEWIQAHQIPERTIRHQMSWQDFLKPITLDDKKSYVVIMTHEHEIDFNIVQALLKKPLQYLGLIGSETKWGRFQERLLALGIKRDDTKHVRCPIGLNIGGKAPEEIAISIAAELLKNHYGR